MRATSSTGPPAQPGPSPANSGIAANNSGFTSGNPPAPQGTQVAFLQTTGSFTQTVTGWAAGSYVLTFDAAQRGNYQASRQDFQVLVDGTVVGTFTPSGTSYQSLHRPPRSPSRPGRTRSSSRAWTVPAATTPPLSTVVVTVASSSAIGDAGFEQVQVGAGHFQYRPTGSAWTFSGNSGIAANNSAFTSGNPPAPQGTQVAFLQTTGSFTQTVTGWAAGSYVITFDAAQRGNYQASRQDFQVLVDGVVVGTFTPSGTSYQSLHDRRVHRHGRVAHDQVPGPGQCRRRQHRLCRQRRPSPRPAVPRSATRDSSRCRWVPATSSTGPTGSPWTFSGNSGIAANNSAFTSGNPPAPQGTQVAFLQITGSFTQTVAGWAAGSYVITFDAAQRG